MTISRKILSLVCVALLVCVAIFAVAVYGFAAMETVVGQMAAKAAGGEAKSIQQTLDSARSALYMVVALGLSALGVCGYLVRRSIVKPLITMESALARVAEKLDFTESIPVTVDDEIGRALHACNRLLLRLRGSFGEIQQSITNMLEVTEEVDQSSRKIARNSQIQSDASANMASAVEQMTASISVVADQANDASHHTQSSRDIAERSAGVILCTVSGIQQIADTVREAALRIKALRADCDSISSVAKMIREVADQTNLLALNAAIEAARAGEQGRGFAVVADEVRKLAERTTLSTQEISGLLNRMQESARLAVDSMSHTERAVDDGVVNARQAGESIEQIKTGSEAAASVVADISGAMREQETASSAIARNIEQIAQMSEQNSSAANASAIGAGRMIKVGREMAQILSAYTVDAGPKKIVLRSVDVFSDDHPAVRAVRAMADTLNQRSNGRITLKVISGGAFGSEKETLEQVKSGALDMIRANCALLNKDCPSSVIPTLPFMFSSIDHMHRALDGAPGKNILESCTAAGYIGLAFYDCGSRSIYANTPIRSLDDLRGLKMRVQQSDLWVAIANAMGAKVTPLPLDQVISGARTGLIDVAETNILLFDSYKHYEAFKYYCYTEHAMVPDMLLFSKQRWDALSAEDQVLIADAARESVAIMRRFWHEREEVARKNAAAAGTVFITNVNKKSFQDAMRPVYDKFVSMPKQKILFQAIQAMR
ncbi:MAG: TRAP transporter substrate-binding protein DctP [Formivibrio sp.]|nr:TRAP transporter substrate-binding protein DctP [Formivibrio sp.]